jgi:hypothetical protein
MEKDFLKTLKKLNTPAKIQDYLNSISFNFEKDGETCRSPFEVWKHKKAHCLEGAMFAAAALRTNGKPPLLLDLRSAKKDFDHVVALFKRNGKWGAISKTNHTVLRYREPVYASIRELALSYFHEYFLNDGTKTLESFSTKSFKLPKNTNWIFADEDLWDIGADLEDAPHTQIATKQERKAFRKADKVEIQAGKIVEYKYEKNS